MSRPTVINDDIAAEIFDRISSGESLRSVCLSEHMPDKSNVFRRIAKDDNFRDQYEIAVAARTDLLVEEMLDIADDGTNDWMEKHGKDGENLGYQINGEHVQRSRLRLDTRKWIASKLKPKKYGDRIQTDTQLLDKNGAPTDPADNLLTWLASLGNNTPSEEK